MAFEQRENTGSLFVNDKRTSDKHPNAKGSALIGGVEYWVSAWTKTRGGGERFQSLAFTPKDRQGDGIPAPQQRQNSMPERRQQAATTEPTYSSGPGVPEQDIPFAPNII